MLSARYPPRYSAYLINNPRSKSGACRALTLVPTHRMMADGMTKVVDKDKFFKCRDYAMGIEEKW